MNAFRVGWGGGANINDYDQASNREIDTHTQTDRQTDRQTEKPKHRQTERQIDQKTDRQTQAGGQTAKDGSTEKQQERC